MFQPRKKRFWWLRRHGRGGLVVGATLVGVLLVALLLLDRPHPGVPGPAPTTPIPVGSTLKGSFDGASMHCPGSSQSVPGDTCVVPLTLAGDVTVHVSWTGGEATTLLALGMRNAKGQDLGPQVTGRGGSADFKARGLPVGTYQLRIVNVQAAHGLAFVVSLH